MQFLKTTQFWLIDNLSTGMTRILKRPSYKAAILLFLVSLFAACTKPEVNQGINLADESNLLNVEGVDTFTVRAYTLREDSIRSDNLNPGMVGAYVDPIFGFAKASHVTELRVPPGSGNPVFVTPGTSLSDVVVDSVVLSLSFLSNLPTSSVGLYGNDGPQYFQVFEVTDSLSVNERVFHNRKVNIVEEDLVLPGFNFRRPKPNDTTFIGGAAALPELRLRLNNEIAERIISVNGGAGLTGSALISELKGLMVTVDEQRFNPFGAGIVYFDTFTQLSRLTMFYRNTATQDTTSFGFVIRNNSGKFNLFEHVHDLGEQSLVQQVVQGDTTAGALDLYVQAMGGTKVRIDLPFIESLRGMEGQAINLAALTVPVRMERIGRFAPPPDLFIFGINDEGNAFLLDDQLDGSGFVGGFFDAAAGHYRFNISRYLQQVINGTRPFNGLEIVSQRAAYSANRVVLNGPEYPDPASTQNNMKLQIVFTKF